MYVAGIDVGNGCTKANIDGESIVYASSVAYVTNPNPLKIDNNDIGKIVDDIFNQMDASFDSPTVRETTRRLFGDRGVKSGLPLEEFDVYSHESKAEADLSGLMVLGTVAGKALKDYYKANQALPKDVLDVECIAVLALPINEFKRYRDAYAARFLKGTHMVSIHNFEDTVRIQIRFRDVKVLAEGESAQYSIILNGEPMMQAMLDDVRSLAAKTGQSVAALDGVTAKDVLGCHNTVGIDIGEGTTNFPVFSAGEFNQDASSTFEQGYGAVLTRSLDRLKDEGYPFKNRKELSAFLQVPPSGLMRPKHEHAAAVIASETVAFCKEVCMQFIRVMQSVGGFTEVAYVYGGGATPVQSVLHPMLMEKMSTFGQACPILYLDSRYSRKLNGNGLYNIAQRHAARLAQQDAAQQQAKPKGKR